MKLSVLLSALAITVFSITGIAFEWNKTQDEKISDIDKLILKQTILLEMQVKYNEVTAPKIKPVKEKK